MKPGKFLIFLALALTFIDSANGQQNCSSDLEAKYFEILEKDGVLKSETKKKQDSASLKLKHYKKDHNDDVVLRQELKNMHFFSECNFLLQSSNIIPLNNESLYAFGSRAVKSKDIKSVNFSLQPTLIVPEFDAFTLLDPNSSFKALKFTSNKLNEFSSKMSASADAIVKAKVVGELNNTNAKQRTLSVLGGNFDTYQGEFMVRMNRADKFSLEETDFFMDVWKNATYRVKDFYVIKRINGLFIQNSIETLSSTTGSIQADLKAAFNYQFGKADISIIGKSGFKREITASEKVYSFYHKGDSIDYEPMPTNQTLKISFEKTMADLIKIETKEINLDVTPNDEIKFSFKKLPPAIGNNLRLSLAPIESDPILKNVITVENQPKITYNNENGTAEAAFAFRINREFFENQTSEFTKTGYSYLPLHLYQNSLIPNDTLFLIKSNNAVTLELRNYPLFTNQENILNLVSIDSAKQTGKFRGFININLAPNQSLLEIIPGNNFFTQLDSVGYITNGLKLQTNFIRAKVKRDGDSRYSVDVDIDFPFFEMKNVKSYKLTSVIPVKSGVVAKGPRRYVNITLNASEIYSEK